jgi:dihydroorotase
MLTLGMPLADVVTAVTTRPAQVIGRGDEIGSIAVGRAADLTLFELLDGGGTCGDAYGNERALTARVHVRGTIRAGVPWGGPFPHPATAFGVSAR